MKARASAARIESMCREARSRHILGSDADGHWWKDPDGRGRTRPTEAARDKDLEIHIAGQVLEAIGIADWHSYPWHKVASGGAETIVGDVVARELELRKAEAEAAPYDALLAAAQRTVRR